MNSRQNVVAANKLSKCRPRWPPRNYTEGKERDFCHQEGGSVFIKVSKTIWKMPNRIMVLFCEATVPSYNLLYNHTKNTISRIKGKCQLQKLLCCFSTQFEMVCWFQMILIVANKKRLSVDFGIQSKKLGCLNISTEESHFALFLNRIRLQMYFTF